MSAMQPTISAAVVDASTEVNDSTEGFNSRRTTWIVFIIVMCYLSFCLAFAQDHCSEVLQAGIFETTDRVTLDEQAASYANWFCSKAFSTSSEAENFGASLGFPFKGLPAKLGFDSSKQSFSDFFTSFCQDVRESFSHRQTLEEHIRQASVPILAAFQACINRKGAEVFVEHTANPKVFGYVVKFDTPSPRLPSIVVRLTVPKSVTCAPDATSVRVESPTEFRATCTRMNDELVKLAPNSDDFILTGAGELVLAAIPPPAPPTPPPPALTIDAVPVKIDFPLKNQTQKSGCRCEDGSPEITFPGDIQGIAGQPVTFRYDGSEVCHGQDFRNFDGIIRWNGTLSAAMVSDKKNDSFPGIAGTLKVTFSQPGSFNVRATFTLNCIDGFFNCSQQCKAEGIIPVVIR